MSDYLHIERIKLPRSELASILTALREAGNRGMEAVALFAGRESGREFEITTGIVPRQKSYRLEDGLLYAVEGTELHRINVWLHDNALRLIAQIHTHPGEAYHSKTDDRFPIVDTFGSISIVVPDFALGGIQLDDWAVYRCSKHNGWTELSLPEKRNLIRLI